MSEKDALARAKHDARQGKSPSTQAGEFVREEIHQFRKGKDGARSVRQAIAIGLARARDAGIDLPPPPSDKASTRKRRTHSRLSATRKGDR